MVAQEAKAKRDGLDSFTCWGKSRGVGGLFYFTVQTIKICGCRCPISAAFFLGLLAEPLHGRCVSHRGARVRQKDIGESRMTMGDQYLTKAAEFHARSRNENEYDERARREYDNLARQYLRLAQQAIRDEFVIRMHEPPPPKIRRQS